jgi:hypothetical protein
VQNGVWRQAEEQYTAFRIKRRASLCASQRKLSSTICCTADVAFEIHSPTDSPGQIQRKRKDYQESGAVQVWFDLERRLAELIYPDRPLQYFEENQPLVIVTVPGFSLDLKELYSS